MHGVNSFSLNPVHYSSTAHFITGLRQFTFVYLPQTQPQPPTTTTNWPVNSCWHPPIPPDLDRYRCPTPGLLLQRPPSTPPKESTTSPVQQQLIAYRSIPLYMSIRTIYPQFNTHNHPTLHTTDTAIYWVSIPPYFEQHFGGPLATTDDRLMYLSFS